MIHYLKIYITDNEKLFDYRRVFKKDRYLTKIITKKFENGFV